MGSWSSKNKYTNLQTGITGWRTETVPHFSASSDFTASGLTASGLTASHFTDQTYAVKWTAEKGVVPRWFGKPVKLDRSQKSWDASSQDRPVSPGKQTAEKMQSDWDEKRPERPEQPATKIGSADSVEDNFGQINRKSL
jgi:hypothetical protein